MTSPTLAGEITVTKLFKQTQLAINNNNLEELTDLRKQLAHVLKNAIMQNNSKIAACLIEQATKLITSCTNQDTRTTILAVLFDFKHKALPILNKLLEHNLFSAFNWYLSHHPIIKEYAEETNQADDFMAEFTTKLQQELLDKDVSLSLPNLGYSYEYLNHAISSNQSTELKLGIILVQANLHESYYQKNPAQFASGLNKFIDILIANSCNTKLLTETSIMLDIFETSDYDSTKILFTRENKKLIAWAFLNSSFLLNTPARNSDNNPVILQQFITQVEENLQLSNLVSCINNFNNKINWEAVKSIINIYNKYYKQDINGAASGLIDLAKLTIANPGAFLNPFNQLRHYSSTDTYEENIPHICIKQNLELLAWEIFNYLDLESSLQTYHLISRQDALNLRGKIYQQLKVKLGSQHDLIKQAEILREQVLLNQLRFVANNAYTRATITKARQLLTEAYLARDSQVFIAITEKLLGTLQTMYNGNNLHNICHLLSSQPEKSKTILFDALQQQDQNAAKKTLIDMLIPKLFALEKQSLPRYKDLYESNQKQIQAEFEFKQQTIKFYQELYSKLNLSEKIIETQLTPDYRNNAYKKISTAKDRNKDLIDLSAPDNNTDFEQLGFDLNHIFTKAFQSNDQQKFTDTVVWLRNLIHKLATENKSLDKIELLLSVISHKDWPAGLFHNTHTDACNAKIKFMLQLLTVFPENIEFNIVTFNLINLIDFNGISEFNQNNFDKIRTFKAAVLTQLFDAASLSNVMNIFLASLNKPSPKIFTASTCLEILFAFTTEPDGKSRFKTAILKLAESAEFCVDTEDMLSLSGSEQHTAKTLLDKKHYNKLLWAILNRGEYFAYSAQQHGICDRESLQSFKNSLRLPYPMLADGNELLAQPGMGLFKLLQLKFLYADFFYNLDAAQFSQELKLLINTINNDTFGNLLLANELMHLKQNKELLGLLALLKSHQINEQSKAQAALFLAQRINHHYRISKDGLCSAADFKKYLTDTRKFLEDNNYGFSIAVFPPTGTYNSRLDNPQDYVWQLYFTQCYLEDNAEQFAALIKAEQQLIQDIYNSDNPKKNQLISQILRLNSKQYTNIFKCLYAKHGDGLLRHLVKIKFKQLSKYTIKYMDYDPDKLKFEDNVFNKLNLAKFDLDTPQSLLQENPEQIEEFAKFLQQQSNNGADLAHYNLVITVASRYDSVNQALIPPQPNQDSQNYLDLYNKMQRVWLDHLVAHRFAIGGKSSFENLCYSLEGSYSITMVKESQRAFEKFIQDPLCQESLQVIKQIVFNDQLTTTMQELNQDMQNIFASGWKHEDFQNRANQPGVPISIPTYLTFGSAGQHATGVVLFKFEDNHYAIFTNRGANATEYGLQIYQVQHPANIYDFANTMIESNQNPVTPNVFEQKKQLLGLNHCYTINKKQQKAGNCGYSSCGKLLVQANALVRFFVQAKSNNKNLSIKNTFKQAAAASAILAKAYSLIDRKTCIIEYIAQCKKLQIEPNHILLAQVYLKTKRKDTQRDIAEILQAEFAFHNEDLIAAKQKFVEYLRDDFLLKKARVKNHLKVNFDVLDDMAQELVDIYLSNTEPQELLFSITPKITYLQKHYAKLEQESFSPSDFPKLRP